MGKMLHCHSSALLRWIDFYKLVRLLSLNNRILGHDLVTFNYYCPFWHQSSLLWPTILWCLHTRFPSQKAKTWKKLFYINNHLSSKGSINYLARCNVLSYLLFSNISYLFCAVMHHGMSFIVRESLFQNPENKMKSNMKCECNHKLCTYQTFDLVKYSNIQ